MMMTCPKKGTLWVFICSKNPVFDDKETKLKSVDNMHMEETILPPFSIFFGHNLLQHSGAGYDGVSCFHYNEYIMMIYHPVK